MENLGFDVKIWLGPPFNAARPIKPEVLHNVTEIHYKYPPILSDGPKVAFESDIHGTGNTYYLDMVLEWEATLATEEHPEF